MVIIYYVLLYGLYYVKGNYDYTLTDAAIHDCSKALGKHAPNDYCEQLCNVGENRISNTQKCFLDVKSMLKCYARFNFWFTDESGKAPSTMVKLHYFASTSLNLPRDCQTFCQKTPLCHWFVFKPLTYAPYPKSTHNCFLMRFVDQYETLIDLKHVSDTRPAFASQNFTDKLCLRSLDKPKNHRLICHDFNMCADWGSVDISEFNTTKPLRHLDGSSVISGPQYCNFDYSELWEEKFCPSMSLIHEQLYPCSRFRPSFYKLKIDEFRVTDYLVQKKSDKCFERLYDERFKKNVCHPGLLAKPEKKELVITDVVPSNSTEIRDSPKNQIYIENYKSFCLNFLDEIGSKKVHDSFPESLTTFCSDSCSKSGYLTLIVFLVMSLCSTFCLLGYIFYNNRQLIRKRFVKEVPDLVFD